MKILAIEKEVEATSWEQTETLLAQEAYHVFQLYLSGYLREIYFTEHKNAVLILETQDLETAKTILSDLPLVKEHKISFEISVLSPYSGFERIINRP